MKKKGLIISTVVMVVVLIASLTTATYAWFTTTASAKIDELQVQTQSSKGLEIGIFTPGSGDPTVTSGTANLNANAWKGENDTWGSSIAFNNKNADAQIEYMGVSGNGVDMYMLQDDKTAFAADGTVNNDAVLTKIDTPNTNYFMAYVAIQNTEEKNAKALEITSLDITATANANGLTGMAASLRIAVFGKKGTQKGDAGKFNQLPASFDATSDLIAVYAPFNNLQYVSGKWSQQTGKTENKYVQSPHADDNKYQGHTSGSFTEAKFISIDQAGVTDDSAAAPDTLKGEHLALGAATIDQGDIFYMMIVIWFEGEDAQCSNYFAGGGATISFTFGKVAD